MKKSKKFKQNLKGLSLAILEFIKDFSEMLPRPLEGKFQYARRIGRIGTGYPNHIVKKEIHNLEKRGFIRFVKTNQNPYILTNKALLKILSQKIISNERMGPGVLCMIIFDVPEKRRRGRNIFRRILKQNGFVKVQKSVFAGRTKLASEFFELVKILKLEHYVKVYEAKKVG